jgi:hypothetical protein
MKEKLDGLQGTLALMVLKRFFNVRAEELA